MKKVRRKVLRLVGLHHALRVQVPNYHILTQNLYYNLIGVIIGILILRPLKGEGL